MIDKESPTLSPARTSGTQVWVCAYAHRHGVDAWVCESEDLAFAIAGEAVLRVLARSA